MRILTCVVVYRQGNSRPKPRPQQHFMTKIKTRHWRAVQTTKRHS